MAERRQSGHRWGLHRVRDRQPRLPQSAMRIDNSLPLFSNELLIDVECLNIDAASFVQMEKQTRGDEKKIAQIVLKNTRTFGKQHNQVTGSGGMLVGKVSAIGSQYQHRFRIGDPVATLVSLTLTPLHIDKIIEVNKRAHQIRVKGHAILFESGIVARIPKDLPQNIVMAVLDVAGAPATVNAICRKGQRVVVIGAGGKAGILSCIAARQKVGASGKVYGVEPYSAAARDLKKLGVCDAIWKIDATNPVVVASRVERETLGKMADVVINVASVPNTELSAILSAAPTGKIVFFSMATSFTRTALGAEGVASRATLLVGNGYYPGHAQFSLGLLRKYPALLRLFSKRYDRLVNSLRGKATVKMTTDEILALTRN